MIVLRTDTDLRTPYTRAAHSFGLVGAFQVWAFGALASGMLAAGR